MLEAGVFQIVPIRHTAVHLLFSVQVRGASLEDDSFLVFESTPGLQETRRFGQVEDLISSPGYTMPLSTSSPCEKTQFYSVFQLVYNIHGRPRI